MAEEPTSRLLFDSGKEGYPRYRIPSLIVTPKGALLAICEGRNDGGGLTGDIDIVCKRSTDQGATWSDLSRIADAGKDTLGNPCAVVDRDKGVIWLALSCSAGGDLEKDIVRGRTQTRTRVLLCHSRDDGKTWSDLRDITASTKLPEWTWFGAGPGTGVQLADGRLMIPCYHADERDRIYRSHVIFSDDHGKTWSASEPAGAYCGECYVVPRRNGEIYLNARTNQGLNRRTVAISKDRGATWSATYDENLYDPHCQGCVIAIPSPENTRPIWLFSNPAGPGRHDLTLRVSFDEGKTWPKRQRIASGDGQYTSLAVLPNGRIACLYDAWRDGDYRLYFTQFALED